MKPTGQAPPGTTDEQDVAETYDAEELGAEYPPRRPLGVEDFGTTPAEEIGGESVAEAAERERPEKPVGREREQIVAVEPGDANQERELVGEVVDAPTPEPGADQEDPAGRLGNAAVAAEDAALHTEESAIGPDAAARRAGIARDPAAPDRGQTRD